MNDIIINELMQRIKSDKDILISELENYHSFDSKKTKKMRNCCHCDSSDGLHIKEKDGEWTYYCFSCHTGGDAVKLIQRQKNINCIQALKFLNEKYNLGYDLRAKNYTYKPDPVDEKIKELLEESDRLIAIDFEKAYNLRMKARDLEENKKNKYKNKDVKINPVLKVEKTLSEYQSEIEALLDLEGTILCTAPTGIGKTFSFIKAFKETSEIDRDRVFVILCPNRVQNEQNGKDYKINVVVGGKQAEQHIQVLSAVYEKIGEIMEAYHGKKITLVIDEAHQLIESISYRESAINQIDAASKKAYNVIHLTATDRKIKEFYNYNYQFKFEFEENNNNLETLSIIPSKDVDQSLYFLLRVNKDRNRKSLVFLSGSKQDLLNTSETLKAKNFRVGTITSDDKQSQLYLNIVENSIIPDDYDVILSTKVLECGTNIKNVDIVPIEVVKNSNHFDLDSTEQKFARLRLKNQTGYIIVKEPKKKDDEEIKEIRSFQTIKKDLMTSLNYSIIGINSLIRASKTNLKEIKEALTESIKLSVNAICGSLSGILEIDEETFDIKIDEKKLINKAFKMYDKQFLEDLDELKKELKNRIKTDNVEVLFDISNEETNQFKEELKETKKLKKEIKEANKEKAQKIILDLHKNTYLEEYLASKDKFALMQSFKNYVPGAYEQFKFLEGEEKELLKVKKLYNITILSENLDLLIKYYKTCKTVADADRIGKHFNYLEFNQINVNDIPDVYSSYGVLRRRFDKMKRKRITQKDIISAITELHCKKLLWQFDKRRVKEDFETYLNEEDKKKKEKALKRICDKTTYELSLIYELKKDAKGYFISSLK